MLDVTMPQLSQRVGLNRHIGKGIPVATLFARMAQRLLACFAFLSILLCLPAHAVQLPVCSTVLTTAARVDLPYTGLAPDFMIGLCDGKVLVSNTGGAQVYDALTGSVVHEITGAFGSAPVWVRSRNAAYFLGSDVPSSTLVEFNVSTGAKRVITLSEPVYKLQTVVGRHLMAQTAVEPLKKSNFPDYPMVYNYQSGFIDLATGMLMPLIGSGFGIGANCVYFACGAYKHLEAAVGYPLSSRFVGIADRSIDGYSLGRQLHGVYDVDQDSLAVRFRNGFVDAGDYAWVAVTPDESRLQLQCTFILNTLGGCFYELDARTLSQISSSANMGRPLPVFSADSRFTLNGLNNLLEDGEGVTSAAFTGISGYEWLNGGFSADARYAIGYFSTPEGARLVAEPLPTPGPLPASTIDPVPVVLAGPVVTRSFFNTQVVNRLFRTDLGEEQSFNTVSSSTVAGGTQVVVKSRDVTRTYLLKADGVYLTRVDLLVDAATSVYGSATFSPAVLVLPASAAVGDEVALSGTVQISVPNEPPESTSYSGVMRVEALSRESVAGSMRDSVQMYTQVSFYKYVGELDDILVAARLEDRTWYARDFGMFRNVSYVPGLPDSDFVMASTYESSSAVTTPGGSTGSGGGAVSPWMLLLLLPLAFRGRRLKK